MRKKRIVIALTEKQYEQMKSLAQREDQPLARYIWLILLKHLRKSRFT